LFLCKVHLEARKVDAKNFLIFVLELLIGYGEIHVIDQRKYFFAHSAILEFVTLFHEGIVPQKSRVYHHWKFLKTLAAVALDVETTEVQAPALIFVERTDKNWAVDIQLNI